MKEFNLISIVTAIVGGICAKFLGGMDTLLHALLFMVVFDYATGILKAIYNKQLSSAIGFKGIIKKVLIFVMIAVAVEAESLLVIGVPGLAVLPIREIVIMFYLANEALSFLENAGEILPLPEQLKMVFVQIRDLNNKTEKEEEK